LEKAESFLDKGRVNSGSAFTLNSILLPDTIDQFKAKNALRFLCLLQLHITQRFMQVCAVHINLNVVQTIVGTDMGRLFWKAQVLTRAVVVD